MLRKRLFQKLKSLGIFQSKMIISLSVCIFVSLTSVFLFRREFMSVLQTSNGWKQSGSSSSSSSSTSTSSKKHHAIPNILIFTNDKNLLNASDTNYTESEKNYQRNIQNTLNLHPNANIRFLDDEKCIASIANVMGPNTTLINYFKNEKLGPTKADICRGAALYETGGLYFDIDMHARMTLWDVIPKETQFIVPKAAGGGIYEGFFQAFVGCTPELHIWKLYLQSFINVYEGKENIPGPLGVVLLYHAYLKETSEFQENSVIWQEERFNSAQFPQIPPPKGLNNCQYVVFIPGTTIVPFYSRILGSRACPKNP